MSLQNFIPSVWSGALLRTLDNVLVYADLANRDYEGEITAFGDRVKINTISRVSIGDYARNTDLSAAEPLDSAQMELVIDKGKTFHFYIDDLDKAQANVDLMGAAMRDSAYELASAVDTEIATYVDDEIPSANTIGTESSPKTDVDGTVVGYTNAYRYLVHLGKILSANNTPVEGRWVVVPPWFHAELQLDNRFVSFATDKSRDALLNGRVGRAAGFDIRESNAVPNTSDAKYHIIAGHRIAFSVANQIMEVEAYRPELRFGDAVKGLHVYGRKVTRPSNLAMLIANPPSV